MENFLNFGRAINIARSETGKGGGQMDHNKIFDRVRSRVSNLVTVRDIFFFSLGIAVAFYVAFHIYQWRMGEAKRVGAIVFENIPYVFKQTITQQ